MPQPFSRIVPNANIRLCTDALITLPDMAVLVTEIFAIWTHIEQEMSHLLVVVLGANESPAMAIYSILTAQHLQNKALEAAAKAALSPEDYQIFLAVISVVESVQSPRNQLAHWVWGKCDKRPELLALADPKMIEKRNFHLTQHLDKSTPLADLMNEIRDFDDSQVVGYSKADLERTKQNLLDAKEMLFHLRAYLKPDHLKPFVPTAKVFDPAVIRGHILDLLNEKRLFQEALARICGDQQNTHPQQQ